MRIEIKSGKIIKDKDIRALYILVYALDHSTPRMKVNNLKFVVDRLGYKLVKKEPE